MFSKLGLCVCLALFAFVASDNASDNVSPYLLKRSEDLLKSTEKVLVNPSVTGNLITRITQSAKDLRKLTDEFKSTPTYVEFFTNTEISRANKLFDGLNSLEQLLDLLKLVQKKSFASIIPYAQQLSKEMHEAKEPAKFKYELKALDEVLAETQPEYLQWYKESKVIDKTLALLEYQFSLH